MIQIFTTGGTIDKVYFDAKSLFEIGEPQIEEILTGGNVTLAYQIESLLRKDSLDLTDADRALIREKVHHTEAGRVLITHGTDGMIQTAQCLKGIEGKTVVLFGAMQPARMRNSDAAFNAGAAMLAVQTLPEGVYLVMNGQIFDAEHARKNAAEHRFETL